MKNGLIFINGYSLAKSQEYQLGGIKSALERRGVNMQVIKGNSLPAYILGSGEVRADIPPCDFAVFLDKDLHLSYMLEKEGIRLFNSAHSVEVCDDKMLTYINLAGSGISMPKTISSPLMYRDVCEEDFIYLVEKKLPYPIVVKECFGSFGSGVYLAKNRDELLLLRKRLKLKPHLYQEFIGKGGIDTRVIVIGGKAVSAMDRVNEKDFRSNIELGGKGVKRQIDGRLKEICEKTAKLLGLDYCGIDLLYSGEDYYVCEVNSNACFTSFESVTGINVGKIYADYICGEIYGGK